ncbi:MAG: hypothetical protein ACRDTM_00405 [Micromonosporaceae bacterium]
MHDQRLSAADVWLRLGRLVEAVALAMRKHTVEPGLGICACGRLPERELAMFGARCDVACDTWERAHHGMRIVLDQVDPATFTDGPAARAVGRAVVPAKRRTPEMPRPTGVRRREAPPESG